LRGFHLERQRWLFHFRLRRTQGTSDADRAAGVPSVPTNRISTTTIF
jgi:hypothetical protein